MALELERMSECEAMLMRILWEEDCDMSMHELMDEAAVRSTEKSGQSRRFPHC